MITILVGKSATGKDTIQRKLVANHGFESLVSVTSRPMRDGETNHVDYHFVDKDVFEHLISLDSFIEYREYHTLVEGKPDIWYYGMQKFELEPDKKYVTILDVQGAKDFIKYFGRDNIYVAWIDVPDDVRKKRAEKRGSFDETEWERRLKDDNKKFSEAARDEIMDRFFYNTYPDAVNDIADLINEEVEKWNPIRNHLSFSKFEKYFNELLEKRNNFEQFITNLEKVFPNSFEPLYENDSLEIAIELLERLMNDKEQWLSYFFFEVNADFDDFDYYIGDEKVKVTNARELYDLIVGD